MRTLILDIENSPNLAHVWGLWDQTVGLPQLLESGEILCWAAKWYGDRKVMFQDRRDPDMLRGIYDLVNEADAVVHFNGRRHDMPWLRSSWALEGWPPPQGYYDIDLCAVVKRQFKFPSNKLQYVAGALLGESKGATGGHQLWIDCMADDPKAWARMRKYNEQDVRLTERVYDRLRPWVKTGIRVH